MLTILQAKARKFIIRIIWATTYECLLCCHTWVEDWPVIDNESEATASATVKNRPSDLLKSAASSDLCNFSITSARGFTNTSCGHHTDHHQYHYQLNENLKTNYFTILS